MARAPVHPFSAPLFNTSTNPAIVEPANKTLGDDMDDEKSVLEQMEILLLLKMYRALRIT